LNILFWISALAGMTNRIGINSPDGSDIDARDRGPTPDWDHGKCQTLRKVRFEVQRVRIEMDGILIGDGSGKMETLASTRDFLLARERLAVILNRSAVS
jgi:hypothetical protein